MNKFKAMLFDMDGVLVDSQPIHFAAQRMTLERYGIEVSEETFLNYTGMTYRDFLQDMKREHNLDMNIDEALKQIEDDFITALDKFDVKPIDGIIELLQALQNMNIPAAIASSSSPRLIETFVERLGIKQYFKAFISGVQVEKSKPAPDIYLAAANALKTLPTDCVVLEDSHNGIVAGHYAHCYCIGFKSPHSGNQDLSLANVIVDSIRDINLDLFGQ